ncbi:MAG: enoyl-CoA hydratase/isomerase family protein [Desulfobacteraceae bacterium]|jgi:enoyl-CoA hydratase/carnithine racemase|nr:enoyl-CoA hydratase/isomerase family protein [Desulfobacteraceae bacterium]
MENLSYRVENHIGYLTLNRWDKYNAFDGQMIGEFEQFWQDRRYDDSVRVIILDGGEAKGFCAGLDMETHGPKLFEADPTTAYNGQARMSRILLAMRQAPQPIISCIHGAASGIGFSLAMASDIRIVAEKARFNAAYINIGLGGADMASSYFLPRLIGSGRTNEFLLTGNWMSAEDAMALGFASRLVAKEKMMETAEELAKIMVGKTPLALRMTKEAINVNMDCAGLEAALQMEDRNQMMVMYSLKLASS